MSKQETGPNPTKVSQADQEAIDKILNLKKTETKKAPSPEDKELEQKIREQAYYIWEHRMSGDPERQKQRAKEYGLPENAMTADVVDKMLKDNKIEPGTPAAEKFMREWDWLEAEKMIKSQLKDDGAKKDAEPEIRQGLSKGRNLGSRGSRTDQAVKKFEGEKNENEEGEKKDASGEPSPEHHSQEDLNKAINDFEAKQKQIAEMRAQKTGRFASLAKTLGFKPKNLDGDPEIMTLENEGKELYREMISKGIRLYKGKPEMEGFLKQFDEFEVFRNSQNQEINERAKNAGFPENIFAGLQTLTKKWSELNWKQKLAISVGGGIFFATGAAALGAGTLGAAAIGASWRWGFRAFGAVSAGVGRNIMLDRQMMSEMEKNSDLRLQHKMKLLENYEGDLDTRINEILKLTGQGAIKQEFEQRRAENELRSIKFSRNTFIISSILGESFRYMSQETGINLGSVLKKIAEKTGINIPFFGGGTKTGYPEGYYGTEATGHEDIPKSTHERYGFGKYGETGYGSEGEGHDDIVKSTNERFGYGKYGESGYGSETEGHEDTEWTTDQRYGKGKYGPMGYGSEAEGHHLAEKYPEGKYGPAGYGTEGEDHIPEPEKYPEGKYGPAGYGTEGEDHVTELKAKDLRASDAEGKIAEIKSGAAISEASGSRSPDAEGKIAQMQNKELGYHKVTPGGGIERSAQAIIKANPQEFGIDPKDPKFNAKVGREAHLLARGLADKYGISYNRLNEIAINKVQTGDEIRIYKDPATGKFNLTYNGAAFDKELSAGKVFGGPTKEIGLPSGDIEASQQIDSLEGGKLVPKGTSGGTAAAVEHMPRRAGSARIRGGGGQIPQEILEQEKIAKENWAKASDYADRVAKWKAEVGPQIDSAGQATELRQFVSMRGLLNRVVEDANIGKRADFWNQPIGSWKNFVPAENFVAQDISQGQATDRINEGLGNLRKLYPILESYKGSDSDTIGECLFKAMKDSKNPLLISKLILK